MSNPRPGRPLGQHLLEQALTATRAKKSLLWMLIDGGLTVFAYVAAFVLRLETWTGIALSIQAWWLPLSAALIVVALSRHLGLYRAELRSMDNGAFAIIGTSAAAAALGVVLIAYFGQTFMPRSVPIIMAAILFFGAVGARLAGQWLTRRGLLRAGDRAPVIIYGAGRTGRQLAAALRASPALLPVAFVDSQPALRRLSIGPLRIHSPNDLEALARRFGVRKVLLAIPSLPEDRRREIVAEVTALGLEAASVPSFAEIVSGIARVDDLREVDVNDLLNRRPVRPLMPLVDRSVRDRSVLVTGAGGSIGSELCRQIIAYGPHRIVLFELSEFALYQIEMELRETALAAGLTVDIVACLGSVCDETRLTTLIADHTVDTLFHAAAYKHVPLVETNPVEGARNNVLGSAIVARVAARAGVRRVTLVSTDKAVRPTSVMGATKRLAELIFQETQRCHPDQVFAIVRFGNVLGSSGSVIPLFRRQIQRGGPVTVTHRDMVRYFMTIPEAALLVVQASGMAQGGEVFVLDMGEPIRIDDVARKMIVLSGRTVRDSATPDGDVAITYTGLRPGEKLYEELLVDATAEATDHPKIFQAIDPAMDPDRLDGVLAALTAAVKAQDAAAVHTILEAEVEGFRGTPAAVN